MDTVSTLINNRDIFYLCVHVRYRKVLIYFESYAVIFKDKVVKYVRSYAHWRFMLR